MQAVTAHVSRALPVGSLVASCDNSGAKVVKIITVVGLKTVKGRLPAAGVGDLVMVSVKRGTPEMRKQTSFAIVVRQRKEYRRADGSRIKFADNAVIVLKDNKGNPKGTAFKGAIAKEVTERWAPVSKVASIVV